MTHLTRKVARRSDSLVRDEGRLRRIVVTLYPSGVIGLRPEKTRREEVLSLETAWSFALKQRLSKERTERKKGRKQ